MNLIPDFIEDLVEELAEFAHHTIRQHRVRPGENLLTIADTYYHDSTLWPEIFRHNMDQIADPNQLTVGLHLVIPHLPHHHTVKVR